MIFIINDKYSPDNFFAIKGVKGPRIRRKKPLTFRTWSRRVFLKKESGNSLNEWLIPFRGPPARDLPDGKKEVYFKFVIEQQA